MKIRNIAFAMLAASLLAGCGSSAGGGDTSEAATQVTDMSAKGGAQPNPNLPKPMGAGGASTSGGGAKGGKFRLSGAGG